MLRFDAMARDSFPRQHTSYLRTLPNDTFISSEGSYYRMWGEDFACHYVRSTGGLLSMEGFINLRSQDPFSQGAVATLPTGLQYVRRGNIWILVPILGAMPVNLSGQVPGHQEYRVISQAPYAGGAPVVTPLTISFNVLMSEVKAGGFAGANEPAFPASVGRLIKGKIGIVIDMETVPAEHGRTLKLSSQASVSTNITKGRLASVVVGEVERAFATWNGVLAFHNQTFVQALSFEDMFLVDLVRMSRSTYQPTIALRVRA